jgi:hypothetical protein
MSKDDDDLLDLNILGSDGYEGTLRTTDHHKIWSVTAGAWVLATELRHGDQLREPDGTTASVVALAHRPGHQSMHDLTIEVDHTFYVYYGGGAILVHNNCGGIEFSRHALDQMLERGVSQAQAREVLQNPVGAYWHDGMWKDGFYDSAAKIFIGRAPDGNVTTVITGASKAYVQRLLEARP